MKLKTNLSRQLISIAIIICGIIFISLGLLLPKLLVPIYEKNIYQYLRQPLELIKNDFDDKEFNDIAYLYIVNNEIVASDNLKELINLEPKQILENIDKQNGKFHKNGRTYYYYNIKTKYISKIAVTNDSYIKQMRSDIMKTLLPIIILTLLFTIGIILLWARKLVLTIQHLKEKIDNLSNDDYVDNTSYEVLELNVLSSSIDDMKATLKQQEEYKNQMYQNISHDFKTPLTVIKSHIEAIEDGVLDTTTGRAIIKQQVDKLELKVHSLLYLNKLEYLKEIENNNNEVIDILPILESSVTKFKMTRKDVAFSITGSKTNFNGTYDMWEAITDNLLNNFVRYADKEIKIIIKHNKITFYNDGPNVDPKILDDLFTPYKKGINGEFGLGLSIVKKTLNLLGYEISVSNDKKGVSFVIKKKTI
ncbi:MAG: HAMP domain-containing sensor histidine kinase [Bacilli bacterium]